MKRKDLIPIVAASVFAGLLAFILSAVFFNPPQKDSKVPVVEDLNTTMPDIHSDPSYSSFLNPKALDPTQPVQIAPSENNLPFNRQ